MLKLIESLDKSRYSPRYYVTAETDTMSGKKAAEYERTLAENTNKVMSVILRMSCSCIP